MHHITDNTGARWELEIDFLAIKRVRDLVGFDLLTLVENEGRALLELRDDPVRLVDVVYALLKPQLDAAGVSDVQFGPRLKGDVLDDAWERILGGLVDFFPQGRRLILQEAAFQAGLRIAGDERAKAAMLRSSRPPTSSGTSGASPVASAWLRGRLAIAGSWRWMKAFTNRRPG